MPVSSIFAQPAGAASGVRSIFGGASVAPFLPPAPQSPSIGGFLGNLVGGAGDVLLGLGKLGLGAVSDVGELALEGVTFGGAETDPFTTVKTLAGLPAAVVSDVARRYGPLLPGGEPASRTLGYLYEEPLSFGLDALAIAGGAGAAARTAGVGARVPLTAGRLGIGPFPSVVRGLDDLAASRGAGTAATVSPAIRAVDALIPRTTPRLIGYETSLVSEARNPLVRSLARPIERAMTQPLDDLERAAGELRGIVEGGYALPSESAELARLTKTIEAARSGGVERVYKPAFATHRLHKLTDRILGQHFVASVGRRDQLLAEVNEKLRPLVDEGLDDLAEAEFQNLSVSVPGAMHPQFLPETKVLDETGAPKPVFHGTAKTFENFDIGKADEAALYGRGHYFTEDPEIASGYSQGSRPNYVEDLDMRRAIVKDALSQRSARAAEYAEDNGIHETQRLVDFAEHQIERFERSGEVSQLLATPGLDVPNLLLRHGVSIDAPQVRPVHLDIRNPFDFDAPVSPEDQARLIEAVAASGRASEADLSTLAKRMPTATRGEEAWAFVNSAAHGTRETTRQIIEAAGFDGITHPGGRLSGGKPHRVWIAFSEEQVHPAWTETTGFGPEPTDVLSRIPEALRTQTGTPIATTSASEIGMTSRSPSSPDIDTPAGTQPFSGRKISAIGQRSVGSSTRSTAPVSRQYLGPETDIARIPPLQRHHTLSELDAAAPAAEAELRSALAEVFGPDAIIATRVKELSAAEKKIARKTARGLDYSAAQLADYVGARVQIGNWREAPAAIEKLRGVGKILEIDDLVQNPSHGYRGYHATVQLPSGFNTEIQFHTPLSAQVSQVMHPIYEEWRSLEGRLSAMRSAGEDVPEHLLREAELTEAYLRTGFEPVLTEMEEHLLGREVPTLTRVKEDMRLWVQENLVNPMIAKGMLSPAGAMERAYLPLRIQSGARYDYRAGGFSGGTDTLELHRMFDEAGHSAPVYFPHLDVRHMNFKDFLTLSKSTIGARRAAEPRYARRSTGYLFEKGLYERDAAKAYSQRAAQAVRFEETYRLVDEVARRFGRPVSSLDEISPATERVYAPEGLVRFFRMQMHFSDEVADLTARLASDDEALAQAFKAVMEPVQDEIGREVARSGVGVTTKGLELYALPKAVAERLEAHVRPLLGPGTERNIRLFFDTPTNVWRGLVLAGSPRWVVNNLFGNVVFAKMQGARLRDVIAQLDRSWRSKLDEVPGVTEATGGFFAAGTQYLPKRGTANLTRTGQFYEALAATRPVSRAKRIAATMRHVNGAIEDAFRKASYLKGLERRQIEAGVRTTGRSFASSQARLERIAAGIPDGPAGERMIRQALDEVDHFLNDYVTQSPFGRKVIRRFLVPFWSFYRHVAKLAVTWPLEYPGRAIVLTQMVDLANEMTAEYGEVPSWLEGALPVGTNPDGSVRFLTSRGANPFSALLQTPLSLLHPAWKLVYERSTGRSAFTGREFSDPDVVTPFGSDQRFQILRDPAGVPIGAEPIDRVAPGILEHLLQQVPQYELAKDVIAGGATYGTAGLEDVLSGSGVIRDPMTGEPLYPSSRVQELAAFGGIPTLDYDLAGYQQQLAEDQIAALREALRRSGYGG